MRKFKKFAAMVSALTLAACAVAPFTSFATITDGVSDAVKGDTDGKTIFEFKPPTNLPADSVITNIRAVQIFTLDSTAAAFTVDDWGAAITTDAMKEALGGAAGITDSTDKKDAKKVAAELNGENDDSDLAVAFAKVAATQLASVTGTSGYSNAAKDAVEFISALDNGYYVVLCDVEGPDNDDKEITPNENKSVSLGMLTVIDGTVEKIGSTGVAKVGLPSVTKKVQEDSKSGSKVGDGYSVGGTSYTQDGTDSALGYNDIADYDIGDAVPFKIYGTLPDNYSEYTAYYYKFNDTLDSQFNMPNTVTISVGSDTIVATWSDTDSDYTYTVNAEASIEPNVVVRKSGTTLTVEFEDLTKFSSVDKDTVITVSYSAVLNKTAVVGTSGQNNKVDLTYSNNPNSSGKGTTPEDKVRVYTYGIEVEKKFVNAKNEKITLEEIMNGDYTNVEFNLYPATSSTTTKPTDVDAIKFSTDSTDGKYYKDTNGEVTINLHIVNTADQKWTVGDDDGTPTITGKLTSEAATDTTYYWVDGKLMNAKTEGAEVAGAADMFKAVLEIKGLDGGSYWLEEKNAPQGFNKESKLITITPAGETGAEIYTQNFTGTDTLTTIGEGDTDSDYYANSLITDSKGVKLPGTGGIGTTIFYLGGGAMVAVAGVFLITKKRMGKREG